MVTGSGEGIKVKLPQTIFRSCLGNECILLNAHDCDRSKDLISEDRSEVINQTLVFPLEHLRLRMCTCAEIFEDEKLQKCLQIRSS